MCFHGGMDVQTVVRPQNNTQKQMRNEFFIHAATRVTVTCIFLSETRLKILYDSRTFWKRQNCRGGRKVSGFEVLGVVAYKMNVQGIFTGTGFPACTFPTCTRRITLNVYLSKPVQMYITRSGF